LVADVQNWVNNPSTNFGWLMKYENEDDIGTARNFFSREAFDVNFQPTLTIDFTAVPEPSSCVILGAVAVVVSAWRVLRRAG